MGQDSSPEKDLGLTDPVQVPVQFQSLDHVLASLLAIHEPLGNDVGREQFITLSEFLERNPIGEALATDPDAFQDTIASQLVQNQSGVDFARPFLVVGNDATDEIGVGVFERGHQARQLLLVQLGHGPKHTLAGTGPELGVGHGLLSHTHNLRVLPDVANKRILGGLELSDNVLVQGVHVLHQPFGGRVVHLAGVVNDGKVGLASEVGLQELGMGRV